MIKSNYVSNNSLASDDNYTSISPQEGFICCEIPITNSPLENGWYRKGKKAIRVILGRLGEIYRMSAPKMGLIIEGSNIAEAWEKFFAEMSRIEDSDLTFDVGPTRRDEITEGLNVPEEEDWSGSLSESEDD
jgi:hypothetical protein